MEVGKADFGGLLLEYNVIELCGFAGNRKTHLVIFMSSRKALVVEEEVTVTGTLLEEEAVARIDMGTTESGTTST